MSRYQTFLDSALLIGDVMLADCRKTVNAVKNDSWWKRNAEDALRCLDGQLEVLKHSKPDQHALYTLDCCVVLAEALTEHSGDNAATMIGIAMGKAYELLASELKATKRKAKARKAKPVALAA